jgi:hypothetical protein
VNDPDRIHEQFLYKFRHNLRAQASKVYLVLDEHRHDRVTDSELLAYMRSIAESIRLQCQMFEEREKLNMNARQGMEL